MKKAEARKWLECTVSDVFMDMCFYQRKADEVMSVQRLRDLMDNGTISKEMMLDVFSKQIEKEYQT